MPVSNGQILVGVESGSGDGDGDGSRCDDPAVHDQLPERSRISQSPAISRQKLAKTTQEQEIEEIIAA